MTAPNIEMIASSLRNCSLSGGGGGGGGRRRGRRHAAAAEGSDDSEGVTVELNSEVALPYHWEQCLDIRTGQVYYINWEDGTRTTVDPRSSSAYSPSPTSRSASSTSHRRCARARRAAAASTTTSSGYTSVSSVGAVNAWRAHDSGHAGYGYGYGYGAGAYGYGYDGGDGDDEESSSSSSSSSASSSRGSAVSSTLSSFSPTDESASGAGSGYAVGDHGHVLVAAGCRACFMYFMVPKSADMCPKCGSSGLLHLSRNGYV
ncbi:fibroin heavy chain-like [Oryza brachyantha]|uniref:fibroin heavy chain-like n=1 Tax=Oryza brachyantha TaxID=4533 RepID=UPI001ADAE4E6|nr:fibroin heavy chain-like [Oryza brachyantha]